jgi:type I restriction enzyme S subunit
VAAEQLVTDNLDIWSSAIRAKSAAGRGKSNKLELYGIKKLRGLIRELAVRGLLVPQDPNDEPASELLKKINAEKAQLLKGGKIKKQKVLPPIEDNEKSFEQPEGWEWVKLGDVTEFVNGYAFKSSDFSDRGVGTIKIGDIQEGEISVDSMSRVAPSVVESLDTNLQAVSGDLLIAMSGATTGKLGFNLTNETFYINQRVGKICPYRLSIEFLYIPLTAKIAENLAISLGSAIPNLSTTQIKNIVIAIPPLAEQHRIVAKADELMAFCDQLEEQQETSITAHQTLVKTLLDAVTTASERDGFTAAWARIGDHFDTLFTTEWSIDQLKQTILQLAVMGKLVPQDPDDEPACKLKDEIAKEKEKWVKEGNLKKQKLLPEINEKEKPFSLPESWMWVRFGTLIQSFTNGLYKKGSFYSDTGAISLRMYNIQDGKIVFADIRRVNVTDSELAQYSLEEDDLLINRVNSKELVGKTARIPGYSEPLLFESMNMRAVPHKSHISSGYLNLYLKTKMAKSVLLAHAKEAVGQASLNQGQISSLPLPLPPKSEQPRIVIKVDELMALCDTLKKRINTAQTTQLQLADAMASQAVA